MRLTLAILIALLPAVAVAQDSVTVAVPQDRNCSDFASQQDAQGWYDAIKLITGQPDAHELDADGDGQPCEGIEVAKRETLADSVWVDYRLEPHRVRCLTGHVFTFEDLKTQTLAATEDSVAYRGKEGLWPRYECIHNISREASQ